MKLPSSPLTTSLSPSLSLLSQTTDLGAQRLSLVLQTKQPMPQLVSLDAIVQPRVKIPQKFRQKSAWNRRFHTHSLRRIWNSAEIPSKIRKTTAKNPPQIRKQLRIYAYFCIWVAVPPSLMLGHPIESLESSPTTQALPFSRIINLIILTRTIILIESQINGVQVFGVNFI